MPYGRSWPRFLSFLACAAVAMAAGSQTVHLLYRPLDDLEELIAEELKMRQEREEALRKAKQAM